MFNIWQIQQIPVPYFSMKKVMQKADEAVVIFDLYVIMLSLQNHNLWGGKSI